MVYSLGIVAAVSEQCGGCITLHVQNDQCPQQAPIKVCCDSNVALPLLPYPMQTPMEVNEFFESVKPIASETPPANVISVYERTKGLALGRVELVRWNAERRRVKFAVKDTHFYLVKGCGSWEAHCN